MINFGKRKILEEKAAKKLAKSINELLKKKNFVTLGICGGSSVEKILEILSKQKLDWNKVYIFLTDERILPLVDKKRNFSIIKEKLLSKLLEERKILPKNIFSFNTESIDLEKEIKKYNTNLRKLGGNFDICILSSGEDGHIASLFPKSNELKSSERYFLKVENSPKKPNERISSSKLLIGRTKEVFLLFFGKSKQQAYHNFINRDISLEDCPAKIIDIIPKKQIFLSKD